MAMSTQETLLAFSEWLDSEGLIRPPAKDDDRTHDQVAAEFIADWESTATRATLAGREPVTGQAAADATLPGL